MTQRQPTPATQPIPNNQDLLRDAHELALRRSRERLQTHQYDCNWVRNEGNGMCDCGITAAPA